MELFYKDLYQGEIDLHDSWQIELETIFSSAREEGPSSLVQEFYFFVPASLQINPETYSKERFYQDRTNFVRLKTPVIPLEDLSHICDEKYVGPVSYVQSLIRQSRNSSAKAKKALFLIANIFRTSLRKRIKECLQKVSLPQGEEHAEIDTDNTQNAESWSCEIKKLDEELSSIANHIIKFLTQWRSNILPLLKEAYESREGRADEDADIADQYISVSVDFYISGLLTHVAASLPQHAVQDQTLTQLLDQEKRRRCDIYREPPSFVSLSERGKEEVLYERGINEKLVRAVLFLELKRQSLSERWGHFIASFAAGFAAFIYLFVLFWKSTVFVVNSISFIVISSVLYILKDRIKEVLKKSFQQRACRFFDDFRMDIFLSAQAFLPFGCIKEYFMFLFPLSVPSDIQHVRRWAMQREKGTTKRQESILYYRKKISSSRVTRRNGNSFTDMISNEKSLHTIFRLNTKTLFEKASDPEEDIATYDLDKAAPLRMGLPKVYHLNLVVKSVFHTTSDAKEGKAVYHKYRLIADKTGIRRVEHLYEGSHVPGFYADAKNS